MFSLNSMKKLERLNNEKAIHNGRSYGPVLEILGIFILIQQWLLEENSIIIIAYFYKNMNLVIMDHLM